MTDFYSKLFILAICLYAFMLGFVQIVHMRSQKRWRALWRRLGKPVREDQLEWALRDFILAYDNQEPEELLTVYLHAAELLDN